ncbi:hypothetical protein UFOVP1122_21 [uncultured Caudovirales phage]|uniref:Uncharacterized protein n=1 Tax=uncultured Caudovirales phage TaxID=2100421 RepID=A0A6J5QLM7_9CAUD|nr:hypothetical protein UFOVP1122_21 [uncultured Caudovirales phage]
MQSHPDAIGAAYVADLEGYHRANGQRKAVKAAQKWHKARGKKPCKCGNCKICKQRERRLRPVPAPTIAENATVRQPLSTAPDIAFLDRLIAGNWGDVPRTLLPDQVAQAVEAGMLPPEPSFEIQWAAERSPGSLAGVIAKWVESRATANG